MRVLWLTNMMLPEAIGLLGGNREFRASGGWLLSSADVISSQPGIELHIATPSPLVKTITSLRGERIHYHILPFSQTRKYCNRLETALRRLNYVICPDIVHIHGTEFPLGLSYIRACPGSRVVLSMQGLCLPIGESYCNGLTRKQIVESLTIRDLIRGDTIFDQSAGFVKYGKTIEKEMIQGVRFVIGRTSFDRDYVYSLNPDVHYFKCNESLREVFYSGKWKQATCDRHSLFLSSASYPVKGAHQLFVVLARLIQRYPDCRLRIAGNDLTKRIGLCGFLRYQGYGKLLKSLIDKYNIQDHISFLGRLTAAEMKKEYMRCNVFVCASTCENSPNSLGEAQILGVPCVASAVGGIPSMIPNGDCGLLVDFNDVERWTDSITGLFEGHYYNLEKGVAIARDRHCVETNQNALLGVYREMLSTS